MPALPRASVLDTPSMSREACRPRVPAIDRLLSSRAVSPSAPLRPGTIELHTPRPQAAGYVPPAKPWRKPCPAARQAPPASGHDALGRARALVPILAAREPAATARREVSTDTIDYFRCAGILRLLQPRCFGGNQASVGIFLQIVDILAEGCASSAWVYGVLAELEWVIACLPERGQIDIWGGDPEALSAGQHHAPRVRTPRPGWLARVGALPVRQRVPHASWAILGARCEDAAGNEVPRYLFVPMRDLEIVDDWHTLGMRGTGSFSVVNTMSSCPNIEP